jgi:hypothetical protein
MGLRISSTVLFTLLLLATIVLPPPAFADHPTLVVWQTGGEKSLHAVCEIERIEFEEDGTLVVVAGSQSDTYEPESIARIEILWLQEIGVEDPGDAAALVDAIRLFQNQPNPFSPETRIRFELLQAGPVDLAIYSVQGRLIRTLVDEALPAGPHEVQWDGCDECGERVPSGVYFYNLAAPGIEESRRMILLP